MYQQRGFVGDRDLLGMDGEEEEEGERAFG